MTGDPFSNVVLCLVDTCISVEHSDIESVEHTNERERSLSAKSSIFQNGNNLWEARSKGLTSTRVVSRVAEIRTRAHSGCARVLVWLRELETCHGN